MKKLSLTALLTVFVMVNSGLVMAQTSPRQPPTGMTLQEYEETIMGLPVFNEVIDNWENKSQPGNIARTYKPVRVIKSYPEGKQVVFPKKGDTIVYQLTGMSYNNPFQRPPEERMTSKSTRVIAIDAKTRKVIAWNELSEELKGNPHSSPVTPDGRYIYASGPPLTNFEDIVIDESKALDALPADDFRCTSPVCSVIPTTVVKIDTLTLEPVKVIIFPGRQHHGHVFRDRYMLFDTFIRDDDGLDTFLFDTETDQVIAGVRAEELGGSPYTSFVDHDHKHVYQLLEPPGYGDRKVFDGFLPGHWFRQNDVTALRPFWIAKIKVSDDLKHWEVVKEYPYFGGRANWIVVSPDDRFMYITPSVRNIVSKINLETGQKVWTTPVGDGPYGLQLTADGNEVWVANKGETTGMWGNSISILDSRSGIRTGLLGTGFTTDHVLLSPDGKEMWTSSNGSGKIYIYDIESRKQKNEIAMPGFGDPHGISFVHYHEDGKGRLVLDQNGFHNGVSAHRGKPLVYR